MQAEQLKRTVRLLGSVLIAQAVFRVERGHTDTHMQL